MQPPTIRTPQPRPTIDPRSPARQALQKTELTPTEQEMSPRREQLRLRVEKLQLEIQTLDRDKSSSLDMQKTMRNWSRANLALYPSLLSSARSNDITQAFEAYGDTLVSFMPALSDNAIRKQQIAFELVEINDEVQRIQASEAMSRAVPGLVRSGLITSIDDLDFELGENWAKNPESRDVAIRSMNRTLEEIRREESTQVRISGREALRQLGSRGRATLYAYGSSDPEALTKYIQKANRVQIDIPQVDFDKSLIEAGFTSEQVEEVLGEARTYAQDFNVYMATLRARSELYKAELLQDVAADNIDQLIDWHNRGVRPWENPGLYLGLPINFIDRNYWKPMGGLGFQLMHKVRNSPLTGETIISGAQRRVQESFGPLSVSGKSAEFLGLTDVKEAEYQALFERARHDGNSYYLAAGVAFDELELNGFAKFIIETLADPTSYIGFGLYPKLAGGGTKVGRWLYAFEHGWDRAWTMPFTMIAKPARGFAQTPGMLVIRRQIQAVKTVQKGLLDWSSLGIAGSSLPMSTIRNMMNNARSMLALHPDAQGQMMDAARVLLNRPQLKVEDVRPLLDNLTGDKQLIIDNIQGATIDISDHLDRLYVIERGNIDDVNLAIDQILRTTGVEFSEHNQEVVKNFVLGIQRGARDQFRNALDSEDFGQFRQSIMDITKRTEEANQLNPLSRNRSQTAILMGSLAQRHPTKWPLAILNAGYHIANFTSRGLARFYLMSTMYGPMNNLETIIKGMILGINPFAGGGSAGLARKTLTMQNVPNVFLFREPFTPQLQIESSQRMLRAIQSENRNTFGRIWRSERNKWHKFLLMAEHGIYDREEIARIWTQPRRSKGPFAKLTETGEEIFIKRSSRLGAELAANVFSGMIDRHLYSDPETRDVIRAVVNIVEQYSSEVSSIADARAADAEMREILSLSLRSPDALDDLGSHLPIESIHAERVAEILETKGAKINPVIKSMILDEIRAGTFWPKMVDGSMAEEIRESIFQDIFSSPELAIRNYLQITKDILDHPAEDINAFRQQIATVHSINEFMEQLIERQMGTAEAYTQRLRSFEQHNAVWKTTFEDTIFPMIDEARTAGNDLVNKMYRDLEERGYGLNDIQTGQYRTLIDRQREYMRLLFQARELTQRESENFIKTRRHEIADLPPTDPAVNDWWREFQNMRKRIWEGDEDNPGFLTLMHQARNTEISLASQLDALKLPTPIDTSGRLLSMADIATLWGASPDSITNAMYINDLMMVKSRIQFITEVQGRADLVASNVGRSADSLGYSAERIGQVYDDYLKQLKLSPLTPSGAYIQNVSEARFAEVETAIEAMQAYAISRHTIIDPESFEKLRDIGRRIKTDLMNDPVAQEVLGQVPETVTDHDLTQRVLRREVDAIVQANPSADIWYHGGPQLDGDQLESGFLTNNLEEAISYADDISRGREGEGFVYLVDRNLADVGPSHFGADTENVELLNPVSVLGSVDVLPDISNESRNVTAGDWVGKRTKSFDRAVEEWYANFGDWDHDTMLNRAMKMIFPFWTYEAHRLNYLPRTMIQRPGVFHTFGYYNNETDRGYIPTGTDLQIQPLRSTIFGAGLHRAFARDYPEFYDQFPEMSTAIDNLGKFGLYPTPLYSIFQSTKYANKVGRSQHGEILPPAVVTMGDLAISGLLAVDPDNPFAQAIDELIMPSRFRDYKIAVHLANQLTDESPVQAWQILYKRQVGEQLTEEEQQLWLRGMRGASADIAVDAQFAMHRFRPQEMDQYREAVKQTILRYIPISEQQYEEIRKSGFPIEYYYPYPPELADELRELEGSARWRGLTTHLQASEVGRMQSLYGLFLNDMVNYRDSQQQQAEIIDARWRSGTINQNGWLREHRELDNQTQQYIEFLKTRPQYKEVAETFMDPIAKAKWYRERNLPVPVLHPREELLQYYYSMRPEDFVDRDLLTGQEYTNWNAYYQWRHVIENSLAEGEDREWLLSKITKNDTPIQRLRRSDYENYIRPYLAITDVLLSTYSEDEQAIIRAHGLLTSESRAHREELENIAAEGTTDVALIDDFRAKAENLRQRYRRLNPDAEARLIFWGEGPSTFTSTASERIFNDLLTTYGFTP